MKIKNSTVKLVITLVLVAAAAIGVYFSLPALGKLLGYLVGLFLPFILGYIFSALVNPLASFLQKRLKIPRGLSAVLVLVLIIGGLGSIVTFVIFKVVDEVRNLYANFPEIYAGIQADLERWKQMFSGVYDSLPANIQTALSDLGENLSAQAARFINSKSMPVVDSAGNVAKALPGFLVGLIVFILSSFFMVSDAKTVSSFVNRILPERFMERMRAVGSQIKIYLGGYFKAQLTIMSVVFVILFAGLTILNKDYALLIAIGIAVLDALPFFGSGAALWPWALVSFINGQIPTGIGLMVLYVIIIATRQLIEPKIVSNRIGMNPLLTLMSMYMGYRLLSIGGMILGPILLMLIVSFYKAGLFSGILRFFGRILEFFKREFAVLRDKIKAVWNG